MKLRVHRSLPLPWEDLGSRGATACTSAGSKGIRGITRRGGERGGERRGWDGIGLGCARRGSDRVRERWSDGWNAWEGDHDRRRGDKGETGAGDPSGDGLGDLEEELYCTRPRGGEIETDLDLDLDW